MNPAGLELAGWITSPKNPYFAQATVNRAWSVLFGRGLVHPVDDLGEHNPATHPQVLQLLAADFVEHGFDLRRTLRILAATKIYQQSVGGTDEDWMTNYTTMPVRSLSARQVFNCLVRAAGRRDAIDPRDPAVAQQRDAFLAQIDAPTLQATEFQGGIPQTLTMLNGPLVTELTDAWTGDLVQRPGRLAVFEPRAARRDFVPGHRFPASHQGRAAADPAAVKNRLRRHLASPRRHPVGVVEFERIFTEH